jgi:hypothetical protein
VSIHDALAGEQVVPFELPGGVDAEPVTSGGRQVGRVIRRREPLSGRLRVSAQGGLAPFGALRLRIRVENVTDWRDSAASRDEALLRSLAAVHSLLFLRDASFISCLEPPEWARGDAESCANVHTWPVLVGEEGAKDVMLSSPIILYDYPQIAPESPGELFDGTEIDEILSLRTMALTEDEKREARATDPRAAGDRPGRRHASGVDGPPARRHSLPTGGERRDSRVEPVRRDGGGDRCALVGSRHGRIGLARVRRGVGSRGSGVPRQPRPPAPGGATS